MSMLSSDALVGRNVFPVEQKLGIIALIMTRPNTVHLVPFALPLDRDSCELSFPL